MLRDYQQRAIQMLRERIADRPLLLLPTGAGKTSVAAEIIRLAVARGRRAVFLVHRRELVDQAVERLDQFGVHAGRILSGHPEDRDLAVQVASIPTLLKRDHWPADLVVVDECAHAVSDSWGRILSRYTDAWVIGLTATPIRLDGKGLGDLFGCIVEPVSVRELIRAGHLVEPVVFAPPVDLRGVKKRAGDYALPELAERMSPLTGDIVRTWGQRARGLRTVVFAVNVDHSERIVAAFRDAGVRAEHIDGGLATKARARTLARLRSGKIDMVSNCMVLSEGWDLPSLRCAILARPTKSLALFRQMVGRVMRPPGPVVVLDHAGNHHEHGPVTADIEWTLDTPDKAIQIRAEPTRTCEECYAVYSPTLASCPQCGHVNQRADPEPPGVENPGELTQYRPTMQDKQREYRDLVRVASLRGYKLAWARHQYKERFGVWPRLRELERSEYTCGAHEWETKEYGYRVVERCSRCYVEAVRS